MNDHRQGLSEASHSALTDVLKRELEKEANADIDLYYVAAELRKLAKYCEARAAALETKKAADPR